MAIADVPARFTQIADGVWAEVRERQLLPPRLDMLLQSFEATQTRPFTLLGTRQDCTDGEHAYQPWLRGFDKDPHPALRSRSFRGLVELRLLRCPYCGCVQVRDISYDTFNADLPRGRALPRRRDDVLGSYAGKRPLGRTYL
jgi:hypothetical protein